MFEYVVDVGFTTQRPVIPDQFTSRVTLLADSDSEAQLVAHHMVFGRPKTWIMPHTIIGCGSSNVVEDDSEPGLFDCLDCGIFFWGNEATSRKGSS